jgi:hypothetical protein
MSFSKPIGMMTRAHSASGIPASRSSSHHRHIPVYVDGIPADDHDVPPAQSLCNFSYRIIDILGRAFFNEHAVSMVL